MRTYKQAIPDGFDKPTALPRTKAEARQWQDINRGWWEAHPMRYDWNEGLGVNEFSREFYEQIDKRFFGDAKEYLPWKERPFESLIPYEMLPTMDVLEIGVGSGSHAALLAAKARTFTGIDLTDYGVRSTSAKMHCLGLKSTILRMDAEDMSFKDNSFDFIWSWGVIHHSANTRHVIQEMHRVLRPGGRVITMVYHRNFWNYYICGGFVRGVLGGDLLRTRSLHKTMQRWTDGGIARFYSIKEWRLLMSEFLRVERIQVFGSKSHLVPLPAGMVKRALMAIIPGRASRLLTNRCRLGTFLVSWASKKA
jgi:ubiquinone/menaquinone biosynthesis C-methylase UbiE